MSLEPSSAAAAPSGLPTQHKGVHVPDVPTHLAASVLSALFCVGDGDPEGARDASRKARLWLFAGPVAGAVCMCVVAAVTLLDQTRPLPPVADQLLGEHLSGLHP